MGYDSSFSLEIRDLRPNTTMRDVIEHWSKTDVYINACLGKSDNIFNVAKWNMIESLKIISVNYPEALFCARRQGEDDFDIEMVYARNGKIECHEAIITYPPCSF